MSNIKKLIMGPKDIKVEKQCYLVWFIVCRLPTLFKCTAKCPFTWNFRLKRFPQIGQAWGRSPECILRCLFRSLLFGDEKRQNLQKKGPDPFENGLFLNGASRSPSTERNLTSLSYGYHRLRTQVCNFQLYFNF